MLAWQVQAQMRVLTQMLVRLRWLQMLSLLWQRWLQMPLRRLPLLWRRPLLMPLRRLVWLMRLRWPLRLWMLLLPPGLVAPMPLAC